MNEIREVSFADKDLPLRDDVSTLGRLLGEVLVDLHGPGLLEQVEELRKTAITGRENDSDATQQLTQQMADLSVAESMLVIRAFSSYLRLANLAEKVHRIRRHRDYLKNRETEQKGSFSEVIRGFREAGIPAAELQKSLDELQVQPVFTAHPTEATRRTILEKEYSIIHRLVERLNSDRTPLEDAQALARIRDAVTSAWQTRAVSASRPTVEDELDNILFYLTEILYRVVPPYLESLQQALARHYGDEIVMPEERSILKFGSWVGADMDGNPNVTAATIHATLSAQRAAIIRCYLPEVRRLGRYLSQTLGEVEISSNVIARLGRYSTEQPELYGEISKRHLDMPYRSLLQIAAARLKASGAETSSAYGSPVEFIEDLELIANSLEVNKGINAGLFGVRRLLMRVRAFGFHLATLDARQDSLVHRMVMSDLLGESNWASKSATERANRLSALLSEGGLPRIEGQDRPADQVQKTLEVFRVLADARKSYGPAAIGLFIISMTQGADDVLTALALARIADPQGRDHVALDIAPLLETVDDLAAGEEILSSLMQDKAYSSHLESRGNRQFIMVGYSDSNKDSGIVSARWALQQAQARLLELGKQHGVKVLFFHGRGGTVSRGGGNLVNGISGAPAGSVGGYLRVTEQGEVINQKYGIRPLALRNLELVSGAVLQHGLCDIGQHPSPEMIKLLSDMAIAARSKYRGLVYDNPAFVGFYRAATPIDVIERLEIGSRPASRRSGEGIENLRAIPWVFSWAQTRIGLPGVYGMGTALEYALKTTDLKFLQEMYLKWSFFRGMVNDVEMVLAKSDLEIGDSYSRLAGEELKPVRDSIFAEFDLATRLILDIRQGETLLDDQRTLKRNIRLRNPYVDPLHILQIKLLKKWREGGRKDAELLSVLKATVNGIALGIQNTG